MSVKVSKISRPTEFRLGMSDFLNAFYRQQHHLTELAKYQPNGYYDEKNKLKVNFIAVSVLYYSWE